MDLKTGLLPILFGVIALFYSAVGQAGGTGYIALMGLFAFSPETIKPSALALNILVAAIGCIRFARAGLLTWRTCYPFAILGAPFSVLGGAMDLPRSWYQPIVGVLLLIASALMFLKARTASNDDHAAFSEPPFVPSLLLGGTVGWVSGITGVGGGIFLSPLVLTLGWASTRQAAAIAAAFNLLNSVAALIGLWPTELPPALPIWLMAAGLGGLLGSWLGVRRLSATALRYILAGLLLLGGLRMVAT